MKDLYVYDFIELKEDAQEKDLEESLISNITNLLLCSHKNNVVAEYTLRDMNKLVGASSYRIKDYLPENLQNELPSIEELITKVKKEV